MGADAEVVRRLMQEVYIEGNVEAIDEVVAEDFVGHDPPPGMAGTRDGARDLAGIVTSAFSDRVMEFHEVIDTADGRVVENWAMTFTHTGDAFGLPASGQTVRSRGVSIYRCSGGKIVEHWGVSDMSKRVELLEARVAELEGRRA